MKKRIPGGNPQRRTYWQDVMRRWREGGQSVRAFCHAEGLRESAFYFWRRKLASRGQRSRKSPEPGLPPSAFLPVTLVSDKPAEAAQGIEIVLTHGCVVRVRGGFDREMLADVLAVLEGRPC